MQEHKNDRSPPRWVWDVAGLAGAMALAVGLWWLSPAWSLVVMGAGILAAAILGALLWSE